MYRDSTLNMHFRMADYLMKLLICELMLHFDVEPCTESKARFDKQRVWTIWEQPPFMVRLAAARPMDYLDTRKEATATDQG